MPDRLLGNHGPRIAVMGAGAVGCYFGGMLARAGVPVTLIGRREHVDAINGEGLLLETLTFRERVRLPASTKVAAARGAEIVLLCVKTLDTESAVDALQPHLAGGARVLSLQNGVDNVERIASATGIAAVPVVVYVACAMAAPGHVKHSGRGDLVIGGGHDELAALFARAGVPCRIADDIQAEQWEKMTMNCAYNAISALGRAQYGRILRTPLTHALIEQIVREVAAVARTAGIRLPADAAVKAAWELGEAMAGARSSTAQDLARGRRTEIDSLNGYVVRRGAQLGVLAPVNQTLYALVKLLEETVQPVQGAQR